MSEEDKEMSFEQAMRSLEEIVSKLEEGDVPLEKAISYYQEGMNLSKLCNNKLKSVQDKMTKIMNEQGELESFALGEDEED